MTNQPNPQKIQEMQLLDQNLQVMMHQKQAFQMELMETQNALAEIKKSGEEVYKVVGQLMIKSEKAKMQKELEDKEKILDLRMKTMEKQEKTFMEKAEQLREEIMKGS